MPKKSKKDVAIHDIILQFMERELTPSELCSRYLNADDEEEEEELWDECLEDLQVIVQFRYGVDFIHGSVEKSRSWICEVVPSMDEDRFKQMFRVNRHQFHVILTEIEDDPLFQSKLQFPVDVQLMITLYRLGSSGEGATVSKIATLFGVGDGGTVDIVTKRVFQAVLNMRNKFLHWPNAEERRSIVVETHHELPYCVGYIDGTEVPLAERPCANPDDYYSRKQRFSVKGQVVCDYKRRVRSIFVGFPGSVHDARIYSLSELGKSPYNFLSNQQWLAGDSAYKLSTAVITPFKRHAGSNITEQQTAFNRKFSKFRVRVEHTFGLIKERFNSLKELRIRIVNRESMQLVCNWITVCCVLHNVILGCSGAEEEPLNLDLSEESVDIQDDGDGSDAVDNAGVRKRNALVDLVT